MNFYTTIHLPKLIIVLSLLIKNYGKQIGKYVCCLYFFFWLEFAFHSISFSVNVMAFRYHICMT